MGFGLVLFTPSPLFRPAASCTQGVIPIVLPCALGRCIAGGFTSDRHLRGRPHLF